MRFFKAQRCRPQPTFRCNDCNYLYFYDAAHPTAIKDIFICTNCFNNKRSIAGPYCPATHNLCDNSYCPVAKGYPPCGTETKKEVAKPTKQTLKELDRILAR